MSKTQQQKPSLLKAQTALSSAAVFAEQLQTEFKIRKQVEIAKSDIGHSQEREGTDVFGLVATDAIGTWNEHRMGTERLAEKYNTDPVSGLTTGAAVAKHLEMGDNVISQRHTKVGQWAFLEEMTGFFSLLLFTASLLCFVSHAIRTDEEDETNLCLGIALIIVTFATGCATYAQTSRPVEVPDQRESPIPATAKVIRNGKSQSIEASQLVPGDVVAIEAGVLVPCDMVIFQNNKMKVNNASLNGEQEDIEIDLALEPSVNIFETKNVAFHGARCVAGNGVGICFRTGDATVFGQIASLTSSAAAARAPLAVELDQFVTNVSAAAVSLVALSLVFGIAQGYDLSISLTFVIGIIVACIPEGLILVITASLALASRRMSAKRLLVQNFESMETLGAVSCICCDKTGTLTQNRMEVSHIFYNRKMADCSTNLQRHQRIQDQDNDKDEKQTEKSSTLGYDPSDPNFLHMIQAMILSTSASFSYTPTDNECKQLLAKMKRVPVSTYDGKVLDEATMNDCRTRLLAAEKRLLYVQRHCKGDASETALIQFAQAIVDLEETRERNPLHSFQKDGKEIKYQIPFSSEHKFNLYIRQMKNEKQNSAAEANHELRILMKGAPERILSRCRRMLVDGKEVEFTAELRAEVEQANASFCARGERVLAFAQCRLPADQLLQLDREFDLEAWKKQGLPHTDDGSQRNSAAGYLPMHDLCLVGVASLNDPTRPGVELSVEKCRTAGIKVIMITGDQAPTAAAVAARVNILKNPQTEFNYMVNQLSMSKAKAWKECTGIVVHGDLLAEKHLNDSKLDDADPEKGRYLLDWINKEEVVFARTTPAQKLLIVSACQQAGYVVAVTGDGVNDSAAIKKADVGIAMGSGSDMAKNAADMLLLDDNFSSIVEGVEEGRLVFANLKKAIAFALQTTIPEITPLIFFIVFQTPLPLSAILMLCIDIGANLLPAIPLAYENAELDIMNKPPRDTKKDRLISRKLISYSHLQMGVIQAAAGMYTYMQVLNDFGIRPSAIWGLQGIKAPFPALTDRYDVNNNVFTIDPASGFKKYTTRYGNSNVGMAEPADGFTALGWNSVEHGKVDVRLFYASTRDESAWTSCRWRPDDEGIPALQRISSVTGYPICYTTEALKYAQAAYLVSVITVQAAGLIAAKTGTISLYQQQMTNHKLTFGILFTFSQVAAWLYIPLLNTVLGTRSLPPAHFAVPALSFCACIFLYDELRKLLLRRSKAISKDGMLRPRGWIAQNIYH